MPTHAVLGEGTFPSLQMAPFLLCPHMVCRGGREVGGEREGGRERAPLVSLPLLMRALMARPYVTLIATPNTSTLEVRVSIYGRGGAGAGNDTNIQSLTIHSSL